MMPDKQRSRNKLLIGVLICISIVALLLWRANKYYHFFGNTNRIYVTADMPLSSEKVRIESGSGIINIDGKSDSLAFENRNAHKILFNKANIKQLESDYGENDFLVTYDNKYYVTFRHFIFNWRHQHRYNFHFLEKNSTIYIKVNIEGEDPMKFERQMLPIDSAARYLCNTPVDSARVIYNMVDMKKR